MITQPPKKCNKCNNIKFFNFMFPKNRPLCDDCKKELTKTNNEK